MPEAFFCKFYQLGKVFFKLSPLWSKPSNNYDEEGKINALTIVDGKNAVVYSMDAAAVIAFSGNKFFCKAGQRQVKLGCPQYNKAPKAFCGEKTVVFDAREAESYYDGNTV